MSLKRLANAGWILLTFFLGMWILGAFAVLCYGVARAIYDIITTYPLISGSVIGILVILYLIAYFLEPKFDLDE